MEYIQIATGLLITGESIILYSLMNANGSSWANPVNQAYVVIDVIVGLILLASGFGLIPVQRIILGTSALIHFYRDHEIIHRTEDRFAYNMPLVVVLNIRLVLLIYIILTA
jgi:hypothetical protein